MILIDANLLLYARHAGFPEHVRARAWLDEKLNGPTPVGLPWPTLLAFVRISTNRRVFARPLTMAQAWTQVQEWLACDLVWTPGPTEAHAHLFGQLVETVALTPNLVGAAHLAVLAMEHGLTLYSADGDFARFAALRWVKPLARS